MADNRKLMAGILNLPESARKDLAQRAQDVEREGVVGMLRKASGEMYNNPIVNTAIGFTPVLGDVQAAGETMAALNRGAPWQETAGYAAGMLPFVPMLGKTVWHGSPHTFDKFDLSKIGTGEGAQAYGHGLYLAESPSVASSYKEGLTNKARPSNMTTGYENAAWIQARNAPEMPTEKLIPYVKQAYPDIPDKEIATAIEKGKGSLQEGSLYKVDLPDEQIAKMLDWDKPLSEQSETIQNALSQYGKNYENPEKALRDFLGTDYAKEFPDVRDVKWAKEILSNPDYDIAVDGKAWLDSQMRAGVGSSFYNLLGSKNAGQIYERMAQDLGGANLASQKLYEAGIPGIQYLDQASRGAGDGTRNYVVFSDEIPQILERNGTPLGNAVRNFVPKIDEATGLSLNEQGLATVYHHTNPEAARQIAETGTLRSAGEPDVYVTSWDKPDTGYGESVVPIQVDPSILRLDDEFPSGRMDFAIPVGKSGEFKFKGNK